jgi:hypothetical protein
MITLLLNLLFLISFNIDQNKLIENENISVVFEINLLEETKKKNTYSIKFILKNKVNKPLYYVASYIKSEKKINTIDNDIFKEEDNDIGDVGSNAPPPLSSSAYVNSGGAAKVDSESASRVGGKKLSTQSKKEEKVSSENTLIKYYLNNDLLRLHLEEARPSKFKILSPEERAYFFNNKEKINIPIPFNNITDKIIDKGLQEYNPVICVIPIEGLEINSRLTTNAKKGINPYDFYLKFSKNIVYTNSIKLELEKSFHLTVQSAIDKYEELQSVLNNN